MKVLLRFLLCTGMLPLLPAQALNALVSIQWSSSRMVGNPSLIRLGKVCPLDRHRGGGHPPTPATPPCVRVRTRRFELVTLAAID
jgi:hypothetical protein